MDPIANMLSGIKNAQSRKKNEIISPYSNLKFGIAKLLKKEGYLKDVVKIKEGNKSDLKITLAYENGEPKISGIERISKPGCRIYRNHQHIRKVLNGMGIAIISTSQGVLTGEQARKKKIGGEIICEIY
jgi:small subunit ribosomal protein S8